MRVLIACEESQVVCMAFRARGHEAFSCDIQDCSGGHPEWHIKDDVFNHLSDGWNLMIFHWPCTLLCNSGVRWLGNLHSRNEMEHSARSFRALLDCSIPKVAGENPIPHGYAKKIMGNYSQIIQPYQFGVEEQKATCLWLKNLPPLMETMNCKSSMMKRSKRERERVHYMSPGPNRGKIRSKTVPGIAKAMSEQWG